MTWQPAAHLLGSPGTTSKGTLCSLQAPPKAWGTSYLHSSLFFGKHCTVTPFSYTWCCRKGCPPIGLLFKPPVFEIACNSNIHQSSCSCWGPGLLALPSFFHFVIPSHTEDSTREVSVHPTEPPPRRGKLLLHQPEQVPLSCSPREDFLQYGFLSSGNQAPNTVSETLWSLVHLIATVCLTDTLQKSHEMQTHSVGTGDSGAQRTLEVRRFHRTYLLSSWFPCL